MDKVTQVLDEIERMGKHQFLPIIGRAKGKVLQDLIQKNNVTQILEIGTLFGYSAMVMAQVLPEKGKIITLEIDEQHVAVAQKMIAKAGMEKKIIIIPGDALEVLPQLTGFFDLVFLDAQKTQYAEYLKLVEKHLRKGSIVVADNVGIFHDKVKDYLELVNHSGKYESKTITVSLGLREGNDAMAISILQ